MIGGGDGRIAGWTGIAISAIVGAIVALRAWRAGSGSEVASVDVDGRAAGGAERKRRKRRRRGDKHTDTKLLKGVELHYSERQ